MKLSVCVPCHNRPERLDRVLTSIYRQNIPFDWECIVVDDRTPDDSVYKVCKKHNIAIYRRLEGEPGWRTGAVSWNVAFKQALGEIIVWQCDDVEHTTQNSLEQLVSELDRCTFLIPSVANVDFNSGQLVNLRRRRNYYTHWRKHKVCLFYTALMWRDDLQLIGYLDDLQDLGKRGGVDIETAKKLKANGLTPKFSKVVLRHLDHGKKEYIKR